VEHAVKLTVSELLAKLREHKSWISTFTLEAMKRGRLDAADVMRVGDEFKRCGIDIYDLRIVDDPPEHYIREGQVGGPDWDDDVEGIE
jgi:hypothetical protein